MQISDGFIVGVYNYCDAWCDRCPFTSHCRLFADKCQTEATLDSNLQPVAAAPVHPMDIPPPPPEWMRELLEELNHPVPDSAREAPRPLRDLRVVPERDAIDRRAESYSRRVRSWLDAEQRSWSNADDPREVIAWFHMMIHVKSMRALSGLAQDDPSDRDWPADHDGSAKVALVGIDRSKTAWLDLVDVGLVRAADAAPFVDDLDWLRAALERVFPNARAFIRPGFDEPEAVARMLRAADY